MRAPGKGSCRWSWRSWNTCCLVSRDGDVRCLNWAVESEPEGRVKLSWKRIGEKLDARFRSSGLASKPSEGPEDSSGRDEHRFRCRQWHWSDTPMQGKVRCSMH